MLCRLGIRPRPHWGSLQRSPDPVAGFNGPTSKGRGGNKKRREWERKGGEGKGEENGKGGDVVFLLVDVRLH